MFGLKIPRRNLETGKKQQNRVKCVLGSRYTRSSKCHILKYAINDDVSINRIYLKKIIFFLLFYEKNMLTKYKWLRIML